MNQNIAAAKDDDEIVFKIKRSAIADALRSDFEMPIPVTDANIEVVVNQITALIDEFPTGVPTEFFDLGIDHHKGIDFYRRIYDLLGDINGPCCGTAWASEDSSLVYFAVADEADGLTVFHIPSAALAQIDRRDQGDLHEFAGAIQDLHVDDAYAENSRVLEFARNSPAAASFGSGAEPEFGFYGVVYLYREDGKINFSAAVDSFAFKADTRDLVALRELSDAELASEIEKAGTAMTERVDAHMSHVPRPRRDRGRQRRILRRPEMARGPPVRIRAQTARVDRARAEGKRARPAGHGECRGEGREGPRR